MYRPIKSVWINITLPADVLSEVDRYAEAHPIRLPRQGRETGDGEMRGQTETTV
jgi:hypothetical protein